MKKLLLLLVIMLLPMVASADAVGINGIYYNLIPKGQQAEVTRKPDPNHPEMTTSSFYTGNVVIPESVEYEGVIYTVSSIGNSAFAYSSVTSVTIPNSVTSIDDMAFNHCNALNSISIPGSVKTIGYRCFGECQAATSIEIGDGVKSIGDNAFIGCGFTDLIIPNSVTFIDIGAFCNCRQLTTVTLSNNIDIINTTIFYDCVNLTSVNIPDGVTSIRNDAFGNCKSLTAVTLPNSVNNISRNAFKGCSGLKTITIGDGMMSIDQNAFAGCKNLEAFYNYTEVVPSTNPDSFQDSYVEYSTLYVPYGTKKDYEVATPWKNFGTIIEMPKTKFDLIYMVDGVVYKSYVLKQGDPITPEPDPTKDGYTFSGWSTIPTTMPANDVTVTGSFTVNQYTLTYIVDGSVYKTVTYNYGDPIIPEPDPEKEGYTFSGWSTIPTTMPTNDVTVTGSFAVNQYTLTYVVDGSVYKTVTYNFGDPITPEPDPTKDGYTFSGWSDIPATMPAHDVTVTGTFTIDGIVVDGVIFEETGDGVVLADGGNLSGDVTIPATITANGQTYSVTGIGDGAFKGNTTITSITISEGITRIGAEAFEGCTNLKKIIIGRDVTAIADKAFADIAPSTNAARRADGVLLTVSCYAVNVPQTAEDVFENTPIDKAMLLVYDEVVNDYCNAEPWKQFGTIQGFNGSSGIDAIIAGENGNAKIYTLDGKLLDKPQIGINIFRMNDGATKKVVVK